ncbi:MAG: two-component regulator propeller domain-containing protein [Saprospiraceae bacterium]|nr:two-component regulator propeller domain-containing protein [Saprospiraceae bacterium]
MISKADGPFSFSYLGKLQGLQRHSVNSLLEDRLGNLWIGSRGGLTKYNGQTFTHFTLSKSPRQVNCIFEDSHGVLWFGTTSNDESDGIYYYDGMAFYRFAQSMGFTGASIREILEDRRGNIWIATWGGGLFRYDGSTFSHFTTAQGLASNRIHSLLQDRDGQIWIGTDDGLSKFDSSTGQYGSFSNLTRSQGLPCNIIYDMIEDVAGNLWMGTDHGVVMYDDLLQSAGAASFTWYTTNQGLPNNSVRNITADRDGDLWLGTLEDGIIEFDGSSFTTYTQEHGLPSDFVSCLIEDREGHIWIGTLSGLCRYNGNTFRQFTIAQGLSSNLVRGLHQDKAGNIWIGTQGGGVNIFDGHSFAHFNQSQGLSGTVVMSITEDEEGNIWMGTNSGVWKYEPPRDGRLAALIRITEEQGLPNNYVMVLTQDRAGNFWFGTLEGAVKYDGNALTLYGVEQGLSGNHVNNIYEDSNGQLWFGSVAAGATRYDGRHFTQFTETEGLSHNTIEGIQEDPMGRLWFATGYGISCYDGVSFTHIHERHGLINTLIRSMVVDKLGNVWLGTSDGLSYLNRVRWDEFLTNPDINSTEEELRIFRHYSYEDGFLGGGCATRSMIQADDGSLWIGTYDRLTIFKPDPHFSDTLAPDIQLSGIQLFNEPLPWLKLNHVPDTSFLLSNGIKVRELRFDSIRSWDYLPANPSLAFDNNFLTFQFQGISLGQSHKLRYQYKLEGLDGDWSSLTPVNTAPYGNLAPGSYTFKVKATTNNGYWGNELAYPFTIRPPWWKTWWAYSAYGLLVIALLASLRAYEIRRLTYRSEALRLKEMDSLKTRLYTNITHEFRTPLTVIMGMVDNIKGFDKERNLIRRNSGKLLKLVNQMMDLARFDSGAMQLNMKQADIIAYLNYLVESFYSLAQENEIRLTFNSEEKELIMDFDEVKLQHVIYNLLSNAIKFTEANGMVDLHTRIDSGQDQPQLQIKVQDTGKGIPPENQVEIFDRFYQVESALTRSGEGSGIGLALTKEYVELMGGTISVESTPGAGSAFTVTLPVTHEARFSGTDGGARTHPGNVSDMPVPAVDDPAINSDNQLPILLIVEDNRDVVTYIKSIVNTGYRVETAPNGRIGLEMAIESIPDIVISDVMMPEMDGYELTKRLKNDERTSHIPVILLTAKAEVEDRLTGLRLGADAYLAKPFNKAELLIRLEQLTALRKALHERYANMQPPEQEDGTLTVEDAFLNKTRAIVEEHLADGTFTVAYFSKLIGMSQAQLYRKLNALTGKSPSHFIRYLRLQKASLMLRNTDLNVSEVAWETGFNDPNYFSRAFHQEFGMTPTEWRKH